MLRGMDHIWFWTSNMDRAIGFYVNVLGLEQVTRHDDKWAELDAGPVRLGLHGAVDDHPLSQGGTVVFGVDDFDAARLKLEDRGVQFDDVGEVEGYARYATFRDPDGNSVQIIEYANRVR